MRESTFFITGAANGIGACCAELLINNNHQVAVCDIDMQKAGELCNKLGERALPIALDVRDEDAWEKALDKAWQHFGQIDVLVNNAGLMYVGWVREQSIQNIEHMINVNLLGLIKGVRAIMPRFLQKGHGQIINVASLAGFAPLKGQAVYSATKHAVRAFHHAIALEYQDTPIVFSIVYPGAVHTGMLLQQVGHDASALSFADPSLKPQQVAAAIYKAFSNQRQEILIPALRGKLLRIAGVFPGIMAMMTQRAEKVGSKNMQRLQKSEDSLN